MDLREAAQQALDVMEDTRWAVADQAPNEDVAAHDKAMNTLRAALSENQSEDVLGMVEPVAWITPGQELHFSNYEGFQDWVPLYTAPPKRKPLTEEQIEFRFGKKPTRYMLFLIRSTERAHGIGGEK